MAEGQRRRSRTLVLQALYAREASEAGDDDVLSSIMADARLSPRNVEFAGQLFHQVCADSSWADQHIQELAKNWSLARIAKVDRLILRMAMVELASFPDTPQNVVLDEAIELAREFSTGESPGFVNGILDSFVKEGRVKGR
jgi:N utilization substance protein B